jgi:hypothetical protein
LTRRFLIHKLRTDIGFSTFLPEVKMIFRFVINSSFVTEKSHPLTIPRGRVSYRDLEAEGLHSRPYTLICPHGERLAGRMHSGMAGFGPYYQLRTEPQRIPDYLRVGDEMFVLLYSDEERNYAAFEFCNLPAPLLTRPLEPELSEQRNGLGVVQVNGTFIRAWPLSFFFYLWRRWGALKFYSWSVQVCPRLFLEPRLTA